MKDCQGSDIIYVILRHHRVVEDFPKIKDKISEATVDNLEGKDETKNTTLSKRKTVLDTTEGYKYFYDTG